jgi:hypothetical protein
LSNFTVGDKIQVKYGRSFKIDHCAALTPSKMVILDHVWGLDLSLVDVPAPRHTHHRHEAVAKTLGHEPSSTKLLADT